MKRIIVTSVLFSLCIGVRAELLPPGPDRLNAQVDFNHDGALDYDELIFAITRKQTGSGDILGFQAKGHAPKAAPPDELNVHIRDEWQTIIDVAVSISGTGPKRFRLDAINPKKLGLEQLIAKAPDVDHPYKHDLNYQVRRSKDELGHDLEDPYAQSALFSYARDYNEHRDQWAARGIFSLSYSVMENPDYVGSVPDSKQDRFYLRSASYQLNVGFDKVSTSGTDKDELNSLDIFGTASYWWHLPDNNWTKIVGLTADLSAHDATDFDFQKQVYALTLDLKPQSLFPGDNVYKEVGLFHDRFGDKNCFLKFRWSVELHAEVGTVEDANSEPGLLGYDQFARLGGKAAINILFLPEKLDNRLSANVSYTHYEALENRVPQTHLFSASLQYVLSSGSGLYSLADKKDGEVRTKTKRNNIWTLRLEYTNGTAPLVAEDDDHLLIGLGLAF